MTGVQTCALPIFSSADADSLTIRCGVDVGEVTFYSSPIGGYRATGRPVAYARRLCSVTKRHGCTILVGDQVARLLAHGAEDLRLREVGLLVQPDGDDRYRFHELSGRDLPSV